MNRLIIVVFTLLALMLASCDPGYSLLIYNRSAKPHNICVIYDKTFASYYKPGDYHHSLVHKNYIIISSLDSSKGQLLKKDSLSTHWTTSYSFTLPAQSKVVMEYGFGSAPTTQDIVIDGGDTINTLKRRSWMYRIHKRPKLMLGGEYSLTLSE